MTDLFQRRRTGRPRIHRAHRAARGLLCGIVLLVMAVPGADLGAGVGDGRDHAGTDQRSESVHAEPAVTAPMLLLAGDDAVRAAARHYGWRGTGTAADPLHISELHLDAGTRDGLTVRSTRLHLLIMNSAIRGTDGAGIVIEDAANVTVRDNVVEGMATGIRLVRTTGVVVATNTLRDVGIGIDIQGGQGDVARGNAIHDAGVGILVGDAAATQTAPFLASNDVELAGNRILRPQGLPGIVASGVSATGMATVVRENHIEDATGHAVFVSSPRALVTGNDVARAGGAAIRGAHAPDMTFSENTLHDGPEGLILLDAPRALVVRNDVRNITGLGVFAQTAHGLAVQENRLASMQHAVSITGSDEVVVTDNLVRDVRQGIDVTAGTRGDIARNEIRNGEVSAIALFATDAARVRNNTLLDGVGIGIYADARTRALAVSGNVVERTMAAIALDGTEGARIENNLARDSGGSGIVLAGAHNASLVDNSFDNLLAGVLALHGATGLRIQGGRLSYDSWGVFLDAGSHGSRVRDVLFAGNGVGFGAARSHADAIEGNRFTENLQAVLLVGAAGETFARNHFVDNRIGLHFVGAVDTLVYDNHMDNNALPGDLDVVAEGGNGNRWNITKTPGTNIIGGPFLGGNLWSDYHGLDADLDGLGEVPHVSSGFVPGPEFLDNPTVDARPSAAFDQRPLVPISLANLPGGDQDLGQDAIATLAASALIS